MVQQLIQRSQIPDALRLFMTIFTSLMYCILQIFPYLIFVLSPPPLPTEFEVKDGINLKGMEDNIVALR
jgi:hypothetical protein